MSTISSAAKALALIAFCLALFAPGLARLPPVDRDEARYVQAARQMLETGDFVDIRFQSEPRHKKPAGIYWLQAASVALLGRGGGEAIWAYRIPSVLGAVAAVLLTASIGARLYCANAGLIAGVLLASSLLLNVEARLATTDAALLACIVAAHAVLAGAYRSKGSGPRLQDLVFWGALGAGVLIKGPVAPLVCGVTILTLVVIERRIAWLAPLRSKRGLGLFLAVTVPWLAAIAYTSGGSFFAASIGHDFLGKLFVGQESHGAPPGTHLLSFAVAFWPSSLLAALSLPWIRANRGRPEVRFCLTWVVPTWILCELIATKLPHYVLPVYPAVALLTAPPWWRAPRLRAWRVGRGRRGRSSRSGSSSRRLSGWQSRAFRSFWKGASMGLRWRQASACRCFPGPRARCSTPAGTWRQRRPSHAPRSSFTRSSSALSCRESTRCG
jgi:4-amino-4-deoxy-L-arabinose transferase-like glycosyltransferase